MAQARSPEYVRCAVCGRQFHPGQVTGLTACPVCGASGFGARRSEPGPAAGTTVNPAGAMAFVNPATGRVERLEQAWLWTLAFGGLYFAAKGAWFQAVAAILLAVCTGGLSWLVYPFCARRILRSHYRLRGWRAVA